MAVYDDGRRAFGHDQWHSQGYADTSYQADDAQHYHYDTLPPEGEAVPRLAQLGQTASRLTNVTGALVSLALIAGLGVWGYKLIVRDVSGIPVVQALATPMRIAPKDPGGNVTPHQGLAVNTIAAEGEAAAPAERLVLAPAPIALTEEDLPQAVLAPEVAQAIDVATTTETDAARDMVTNSAEAGEVEATPDELTPVKAALDVSAQIAASVAAEVAEETPQFRSLVPQARPVRLASAAPVVPSAVSTAPVDAVPEIDPAAVAPGTRLVQFGAFDSAETARAEWDKLVVRFEALMADKTRVIQQAKSGGKTFYRLRAVGFEDLSDARRFCAALVAEKAACIPTQAR